MRFESFLKAALPPRAIEFMLKDRKSYEAIAKRHGIDLDSIRPLSKDERLDPNLGTRHRAAIGMSQETDSVVIVVSEEHGGITIVKDGVLSRRLDGKGLRSELQEILLTQKEYEVAQQENKVMEQNPIFEKIKDVLKVDRGER
jgi:hypothetical protein